MRILVVDDAMFMRTILKNILIDLGHEIVGEAGDGKEALEVYKICKPDIVTMDITMPINGIDGVKMIKEYDNNAKIIMCSAMGQQTMVLEAIQNGALDFIVKPFTKDRIQDALKKNA